MDNNEHNDFILFIVIKCSECQKNNKPCKHHRALTSFCDSLFNQSQEEGYKWYHLYDVNNGIITIVSHDSRTKEMAINTLKKSANKFENKVFNQVAKYIAENRNAINVKEVNDVAKAYNSNNNQ